MELYQNSFCGKTYCLQLKKISGSESLRLEEKEIVFIFAARSIRNGSKSNEKQDLPNAQMAESVDALVSNTNAARRAGSTPALGTKAR